MRAPYHLLMFVTYFLIVCPVLSITSVSSTPAPLTLNKGVTGVKFHTLQAWSVCDVETSTDSDSEQEGAKGRMTWQIYINI